ncbi:MAG: RecB-family nuclease, partial [Candidatus Thorarchaeota archaeon]
MSDESKNVFVVLHNVHSVSRLVETAQVVYGLGFYNYVVTRAEGSAAQSGVPDANRLAIKMKRNFTVLPDLKDAIELFEIEKPLMIVSPVLTKDRINLDEVKERAKSGEKMIIALSAGTSSFSRKEMDLGECVSLDA